MTGYPRNGAPGPVEALLPGLPDSEKSKRNLVYEQRPTRRLLHARVRRVLLHRLEEGFNAPKPDLGLVAGTIDGEVAQHTACRFLHLMCMEGDDAKFTHGRR